MGLQPETDSHLEQHEMKVDSSSQKLKRKKIQNFFKKSNISTQFNGINP